MTADPVSPVRAWARTRLLVVWLAALAVVAILQAWGVSL